MAVALAMEGAFGFGLQATKGTHVTPTTWLPLMDAGSARADSVSRQMNYVVVEMADGRDSPSAYYSAGDWVAGSLEFPLVPGALRDLFSWVQDRDGEGQGKWASVVIDCVHSTKELTDVKVRRAVLDLVKGEPVMCRLDICGLQVASGEAASPAFPTAAPYTYREVDLRIAAGGGGLASDVNCEALRIEIDTMLEDPADGLRLSESSGPVQLYNLSGVRCSGAVSRDFADSGLFDDFMAGQEAALDVTLARGTATATVSLPRVLYVADDLGLPGSRTKRIVEQVRFLALGSTDGQTPPVVLT
jgi:hypothetical protein